ncbi:MAG: DUF3426 domain-containing protein [Proteobacteria bacterium]|nr:DUF3426 domain-containing protein [Pseudomonadota bacterium]MDA1332201.1 DUF3426 domain-containing protein [Pseudomonadota bacterium]
MELFLVCPKCTHLFGSTSTRLMEQSGRVECLSCSNSFDGYAHYRFDILEEPIKVTLDEAIKEKSRFGQRHTLDLGSSNGAKKAVGKKDAALQDVAVRVVRSAEVDTNLYEAVFAPLPVSRSRWWYANLMFFLIFILILMFGFNRQIYVNSPLVAKGAVKICGTLGCEVGIPRQINALRLIGADLLVRPDWGDSYYQFRATIQNVGKQQLQFPAMELKLTDAQGRIVTSRVIYPIEYIGETTQAGIKAKGEQQLNLMFRIEGAPPFAFDSYLFYPKKNRL